jgi:hypothetical protein
MSGVVLCFEKNFAHRHESECTTGNLNKLDDKWKDHCAEIPDSVKKCNRLWEARWSGKKDFAKSFLLDMDRGHCLSDKALLEFHSFSMWRKEEKEKS